MPEIVVLTWTDPFKIGKTGILLKWVSKIVTHQISFKYSVPEHGFLPVMVIVTQKTSAIDFL